MNGNAQCINECMLNSSEIKPPLKSQLQPNGLPKPNKSAHKAPTSIPEDNVVNMDIPGTLKEIP